ncbi:MAG: collagen-like protein [Phycisphaerae bacterium]|nr:collagen-like protein [Phycisphaerae bacterium]MBT5656918.1 collagen-like protein [Phycisphaerae bacterium]
MIMKRTTMIMKRTTLALGLGAILAGGSIAMGQAPPPPDGERQAEGDRGSRGDQGQRGEPRQRGERGQRGERDRRGDRGGPQSEQGSRGWRGGGRGGWGSPSDGLLGGPSGRVTRSIFRPDYLTRDLPLIVEILSLDEGQADVVDMLLEDYDANFQMAVDETTQAMQDLGDASGAESLEADRIENLRGEMQSMHEEMREARNVSRPEPSGDRAAGGEAGGAGNSDTPRAEQTDEQREARRAAREAIREQFRERMTAVRDQFREVRMAQLESDVMQNLLTEQMALLKQFQRIRIGMASEMTDAMMGLLSEEQAAEWDQLSRHLRRLRQLSEGRLQGEQTDLGPMVEMAVVELEAGQAAGVQDLMLLWELDLDGALAARAAFDESGVFKTLEAMQAADFDALLQQLRARQHRAEAVRDVTDMAIETIAASLPAEQGAEFRRNALQTGYDRVFRTSRAQRAIEAATKIEDLDEETMAAVKELQTACNLAMDEENEDILLVVRKYDEPREVRFVQRMQQRAAGESTQRGDDEDDPMRLAFDARDELDEAFLQDLRDILGEERVAELPGGRQRSGRGDRGGPPGFDGDREAMRQQFMERFDANGDGEIDDAEREKIGEFFRQMRGVGGPGGGQGGRGGGPPPGA